MRILITYSNHHKHLHKKSFYLLNENMAYDHGLRSKYSLAYWKSQWGSNIFLEIEVDNLNPDNIERVGYKTYPELLL